MVSIVHYATMMLCVDPRPSALFEADQSSSWRPGIAGSACGKGSCKHLQPQRAEHLWQNSLSADLLSARSRPGSALSCKERRHCLLSIPSLPDVQVISAAQFTLRLLLGRREGAAALSNLSLTIRCCIEIYAQPASQVWASLTRPLTVLQDILYAAATPLKALCKPITLLQSNCKSNLQFRSSPLEKSGFGQD